MGLGAELTAALVAQADEFARRLRESNERRITRQVALLVEEQLEQEKKTIDVRVEQKSVIKAEEKLKANLAWIDSQTRRIALKQQNDERYRKWLNWLLGIIGRSASTTTFFLLWGIVALGWGWVGGLNTPPIIFCPTRSSLCYQFRFRDTKSALADMPKPQCSKTRKGLMCLLPKSGRN